MPLLRYAAGLVPAWGWAAGAAVLVAAAWVWHAGAVSASHAAGRDEVLAEVEIESARRAAEDRARAQAAALQFEALRATKERDDADAARRLRAALQRPIACPAEGMQLGDVRVPADVVDGLRAAGADPGPGASAAGEPGAAVLGRP